MSADVAWDRFVSGSSSTSSPSPPNHRRAFATARSGRWRAAAVATTYAGPPPAAATRIRSCGSFPGLSSSPPTSASGPDIVVGLEVLQDLLRGVGARAARDAAARMRAGARQVEAVEEEPVSRRAQERPPREGLIQRRLGVLEVPAREPVRRLEVGWGHHLDRLDDLAEPGREALERLDRDLADPLTLRGPVAVSQVEGRRLERDRHHVLALRRERRIREGRDRRLEDRLLCHPAVLHG